MLSLASLSAAPRPTLIRRKVYIYAFSVSSWPGLFVWFWLIDLSLQSMRFSDCGTDPVCVCFIFLLF